MKHQPFSDQGCYRKRAGQLPAHLLQAKKALAVGEDKNITVQSSLQKVQAQGLCTCPMSAGQEACEGKGSGMKEGGRSASRCCPGMQDDAITCMRAGQLPLVLEEASLT